MFLDVEKKARSVVIDDILKPFFANTLTTGRFPSRTLRQRIPTIKEWKTGKFDWSTLIEKIAPDTLQELPAIVVSVDNKVQESVGIGSGHIMTYNDSSGNAFKRIGTHWNLTIGIYLAAATDDEREDISDLIGALFGGLVQENDYAGIVTSYGEYAMRFNEDFSQGAPRQEPYKGGGIESVWLTDFQANAFFEAYEDLPLDKLQTLKHLTQAEYDAT